MRSSLVLHACYESVDGPDDCLLAMFQDQDDAELYCKQCTYDSGVYGNSEDVTYYHKPVRIKVIDL